MRRKWKLAFVAGLGYSRQDAKDVIASLAGIGYDGIEWTPAHFDADSPLAGLRELVDRTRDAGLEVSRVMMHQGLVHLDETVREKRIERTVRVIEAAGACGVATVGTMAGPTRWEADAPVVGRDIGEGAAWDQVFEAYERFVETAKESDVVITSEGVWGSLAHDYYTHRYLMDRAASPHHCVNFDPSHGILYGNLDVGWVVREWGERIGHVHLKDAVGEPVPGKFLFPLLGEGLVDWADFFRALDEIGYSGFCSVEFESFSYYRTVLGEDPEAAARLSLEQIERLLAAAGPS